MAKQYSVNRGSSSVGGLRVLAWRIWKSFASNSPRASFDKRPRSMPDVPLSRPWTGLRVVVDGVCAALSTKRRNNVCTSAGRVTRSGSVCENSATAAAAYSDSTPSDFTAATTSSWTNSGSCRSRASRTRPFRHSGWMMSRT
ncbi:hypothetical protein Tdes44962_MAKER09983 [Teratosphaeria destructans]|uniref:Uncharacterized protein n=1 Tax=Teratosphaeria destructans TaxID=418781 RepID=A0A9W7SQG5_9PEZI|nr:hypothetical protein Tdes44962_MAKER09983 [Teratosphaeria destructans]